MAGGNHLTFKIGSTFNGEGFKQARAATREIAGRVKTASSAMSQLGAAMGQASGAATGATKAITEVIGAVASMGVTAGVVAIATEGMNRVFNSLCEKLDRVQEGWKEIQQMNKDRFLANVIGDAASLTNEVTKLAADFDATTKSAVAFTNALKGMKSAENAGAIGQLQVDKLQAMLDAHTDAEKEAIEVSYALKEAELKKSQMTEAANAKIESVNAAYDAVQKKLEMNASAQERATAAMDKASETFDLIAANYDKGTQEYIAAENDLVNAKKLMLQLETEQTELAQQSKELTIQQQTVEQEKLNAEMEGTRLVLEAQAKNKEYQEARFEREQAEARERSDQAELFAKNAEAEEDLIAAEVSTKDALLAYQASMEGLIQAQEDMRAAMTSYAESLATNVSDTGIGDGVFAQGRSGAMPVSVVNSVSTQVSDAAVRAAIANGMVNTVKDADKLQRQAMRETRDQVNKGSGQRAQEAQRAQRLRQMSYDALSKQDKDFLAKYDAIEKAVKERNTAAEGQKENIDKIKTAIENIERKIKNATAS